MGPTMWTWLVTTIISPFITQALKRFNIVDEFSTTVNGALCVLLSVVAWYFLGGHDPNVWEAWVAHAGTAAAVGGIGYNVLKGGAKRIAG